MNLRKRQHEGAEVSTESLNDIMFFLLLFFLIISTLATPSVVKLTLPNSKSKQTVKKVQVTIDINQEHQYFLDNKMVSFGDLENLIAQRVKDQPEATVVLRIHNSLTVQDLVDVLQIGDRLKVRMVLATRPPNA